jgi:hypothetical protein
VPGGEVGRLGRVTEFEVLGEQLRKVIRDLDEIRGDLAGIEEVQDT